jgi:hypothetical protein
VAFIEELQRRLGPQENGRRNGLGGIALSKSTPDLAHKGGGPDAELEAVLRGEHRAPFELRALEVALDVVRARMRYLCLSPSEQHILPGCWAV